MVSDRFGYFLTLFAVMAINAFNMVDGIDGLFERGLSRVSFAAIGMILLKGKHENAW